MATQMHASAYPLMSAVSARLGEMWMTWPSGIAVAVVQLLASASPEWYTVYLAATSHEKTCANS